MAATNAPFWVTDFTMEDTTTEGSPSADDVRAALSDGLAVFSEIFGVVIDVVGNVAILADGSEVPVSSLGNTTAGEEPIEPEKEEWIEGVPNTATLGLGLVALVLVAAVLR